MTISPKIYLASKSARRRELLAQINIDFELIDGEVDETPFADELAIDYCLRLACAKADAGWHNPNRVEQQPVLGADTVVISKERIFTKPENEAQAQWMLTELQNSTHQVVTAVAVRLADKLEHIISSTQVSFAKISQSEILAYIASGQSIGFAGGYAIQGLAAKYVRHIAGSYTGVVGLPLYETAQLLAQVIRY